MGEEFRARLAKDGPTRARRWFWRDTVWTIAQHNRPIGIDQRIDAPRRLDLPADRELNIQGRLSPWRIAERVLPADFGEPAVKSGTAPPDHRVWACAERIIE